MPLAFLHDVFVSPASSSLLLFQLLQPLLIHSNVNPAQQVTDEELDCQKHEDSDLAWDVCGCIFWLKDLCTNDISHSKRDKSYSIDGVLERYESNGVAL